MLWTRTGVFCFFFTFLCFKTFGQPFPCDGRLILATQSNDNTRIYSVIFGPFGAIYYDQRAIYQNEDFDALGFNPKDNYIYSVKENTNSIVRLRGDGTYEIVGSVPMVNTLNVYAGDCSPDGYYLCYDNALNQILVFEVVDDFQLVDQLDLFWDPAAENSGPFSTRIDDFAFDPNNPTVAYTFQGNYNEEDFEPAATRGYLLRINLDFSDPNVGMVTPVGPIATNVIRQLGGLFFTQGGGLYGHGPYTSGPVIDNRLISINPFTGDANVLGINTPAATMSDGCSCPYALSFYNNASPRNITCSNTEINFALTVDNGSNVALSGLSLTDTLPEGMIINDISGNFSGAIAAGTGIGTGMLTINDLEVASREAVVINVSADIIDISTGLLTNQAQLTNLPPLFGGERSSDDPATNFIGDATQFSSSPQPIEDVELSITPPSDCLNANDAQVRIASPELLADQPYQIQMVNQSWEEFNYEVVIDDENAFIIDSLSPGEYLLLQVTPENSRCSFGWRDTEIPIIPPNEQLEAIAATNSPLCEGSALQLSSTLSPGGTVIWKGPSAFAAWGLNATIDSALATQSGNYEMIATYGACEQRDTLKVTVSPAIQASLSGELEYCERERLILAAMGVGDTLTYQWSGPTGLTSTSQQVEVPSITVELAGLYQVIMDNGSCQDTASSTVTVLPSPTIALSKVVTTDFCERVQFRPEILGDNNVTYSWTPNEGLSCDDCLAPELQAPFSSAYQLTVINEHLCTDSSRVVVALSEDKIVYVPNAFSPNYDGINDFFQLFPGCGVANISDLIVTDRWGATVYSKSVIDPNDPREFWDGFVQGKIGAAGVYIWQVELELVNGTMHRLSGDVTLLR